MQRLPLSYIRPGMKTYEEVVDNQGRVLCGRGIEITAEMLKTFSKYALTIELSLNKCFKNIPIIMGESMNVVFEYTK